MGKQKTSQDTYSYRPSIEAAAYIESKREKKGVSPLIEVAMQILMRLSDDDRRRVSWMVEEGELPDQFELKDKDDLKKSHAR